MSYDQLLHLKKHDGSSLRVIRWISSLEQWQCMYLAHMLLKDDDLVKRYQITGGGPLPPSLTHSLPSLSQGADDDLLKVWSSSSGQLHATFRGHTAEITDMTISCDNSMIASGSLDKTVRVWCAHSATPISVLTGHAGHITSVRVSVSGCGLVLESTGCVSLITRGSGGTAHPCSGRHSQYSCELLAWVPGVALVILLVHRSLWGS